MVSGLVLRYLLVRLFGEFNNPASKSRNRLEYIYHPPSLAPDKRSYLCRDKEKT
jgi:hypothetical protein